MNKYTPAPKPLSIPPAPFVSMHAFIPIFKLSIVVQFKIISVAQSPIHKPYQDYLWHTEGYGHEIPFSLKDEETFFLGIKISTLTIIGKGSFGHIFGCPAPHNDKVIKAIRESKDLKLPNVLEEYQTMRQLHTAKTKCIPTPFYFFTNTNSREAFILMEKIEGTDLSKLLKHSKNSQALSMTERSSICLQLIEQVLAAHDAGVMDQDRKPANMIYNRRTDKLICIDAGLAKRKAVIKKKTTQLITSGTPIYFAPETASHQSGNRTILDPLNKSTSERWNLTRKIEFWSVAISIHEILTSFLPPFLQTPKNSERTLLYTRLSLFLQNTQTTPSIPDGYSPSQAVFLRDHLKDLTNSLVNYRDKNNTPCPQISQTALTSFFSNYGQSSYDDLRSELELLIQQKESILIQSSAISVAPLPGVVIDSNDDSDDECDRPLTCLNQDHDPNCNDIHRFANTSLGVATNTHVDFSRPLIRSAATLIRSTDLVNHDAPNKRQRLNARAYKSDSENSDNDEIQRDKAFSVKSLLRLQDSGYTQTPFITLPNNPINLVTGSPSDLYSPIAPTLASDSNVELETQVTTETEVKTDDKNTNPSTEDTSTPNRNNTSETKYHRAAHQTHTLNPSDSNSRNSSHSNNNKETTGCDKCVIQ